MASSSTAVYYAPRQEVIIVPCPPEKITYASEILSQSGFDSREWCDTSWCQPCCVWDVPPPSDPPYEGVCCDGGCGCGGGGDGDGSCGSTGDSGGGGNDGGGGSCGRNPSIYGDADVNYGSGAAEIGQSDLVSSGQGGTWGQTRRYSNRLTVQDEGDSGNSWAVDQMPYMANDDLGSGPNETTMAINLNMDRPIWFDYSSGSGTFSNRFNGPETLTHSSSTDKFTFKDGAGREFQFFDFSTTWDEKKRGRLYKYFDPDDHEVEPTYDGSTHQMTQFKFVDGSDNLSYNYEYYGAGNANEGKLEQVTQKLGSTNVQRATYTYYGSSESHGSLGDLKRVHVEMWDGSSWESVGYTYYRYYKSGDSNGFAHGIKYIVDQEGYQRLVDNGITPETTDDEPYIAGVAVSYFEYDGSKRVKKKKITGGEYTYDFAYSTSGFSDGMNNWKTKTTETLPSGAERIVYTNYVGLIMLKIFKNGSDEWYEFWKYNDDGKVVLNAKSSAISGYNAAKADLLNYTGGSYQYLNNSSGLIYVFDYYTSTGSGAVDGMLQYVKVKEGENGSEIKIKKLEYTSKTANGRTIYPLWKLTAYQSDASGGSDSVTQTMTYTWKSGSLALDQKTTTHPAVTTTQHGSGSTTSKVEVFDDFGRRTWLKDEDGSITHWEYDNITGALTKKIEDVNTNEVSDEPAGWVNTSGLNLVTDYESDDRGRITQELGPKHDIDLNGTKTEVRRATWYVYKDWDFEKWTGHGYQKTSDSSYTLINPVTITRKTPRGNPSDDIVATRASTSGKLSASDTFAQSSYVRWTKYVYWDNGQFVNIRVYHDIPSSGDGNTTNYDETSFLYDDSGRRNFVKTPGGTITRTVYNIRGLVEEVWVGTNDHGATDSNPGGSGANNMKQVSGFEYDGGSDGGDGNLTEETKYVNASDTRVTSYEYDYRNRRIVTDGAEDFYEEYDYDNLDRLTVTSQYDTDENGTLVAKKETSYDNLGRVYLVENGTTGTTIKEKTWYGATGNVIKVQKMGSRAFNKTQYNGMGWPTKSFVCFDASEDDDEYTKAETVTSDTVMQQVENTYDDAGNVTRTETKDRFHDADTSTGELGSPSTQPKARIYYEANYPDALGRRQATANYGTAGGSMSWSDTIPNRSATVLVMDTVYNDDGEVWKTIDPEETENRNEYDDAGRLTKLIENYVDGTPSADTDKTTEYTYNADGKMATMKAKNSTTGDQTTTWTYGATTTESDIASKELLRYKQYPDGSASDRVEYKYNRQGQQKEIEDQNGNVRTLEYDDLGRLEHDRVTTLGSGVDGAVRRITRSYTALGLLKNITSYDNASTSSGSVVNDVEYAYNGFGQLETEYQSHSGAVNTSTSPKVQYGYANGSSNTIRRTDVTYPDGTQFDYAYGDANKKDDMLSRIYQIKDGSTVLVEYDKLGVDRTVIANYKDQPGVELTYLKQSGDATLTGDRYPGDDYYGLDRFGRVQDQRWYKSGTDKERVKYGFTEAGNRQWRENTVATSGQDEYYTYDGLYQQDSLKRGDLTGTFPNYTGIAGTPTWQEDFDYDPTGNWNGSSTGYQTQVNGTTTLNQNRTHNVANEISNITETTGTAWPTPTHDTNGNLTKVPRPLDLGNSFDLEYDAWNRLVEVKNTGGSVVSTYAYDGANRRTTKDYNSVVRHYYYSDQWQILEERTDSNTTADRQFVWGTRYIDDLIYREESSTRYYALHDYYSVTAIVDTSGNVQERYGYDAFGATRYMDSSFGNRSSSSYGWEVTYGAYRYDLDSGLFQVRNRYYHPNLGRWEKRDPIDYTDGVNLYAYTKNNPINHVDFMGLSSNQEYFDRFNDCIRSRVNPQLQQQIADLFQECVEEVSKDGSTMLPGFEDVVKCMLEKAGGALLDSFRKVACCFLMSSKGAFPANVDPCKRTGVYNQAQCCNFQACELALTGAGLLAQRRAYEACMCGATQGFEPIEIELG